MTPRDITEGLTTSEKDRVIEALFTRIDATESHMDLERFVSDIIELCEMTEKLLTEPRDYEPIRNVVSIKHIPVGKVLTDEQREEIRREYVKRGRGGRRRGNGPSIQELAKRYGVSYGAVQRAVA